MTYRQNKPFHWAKKYGIDQLLKDDKAIHISPNYSRHAPSEYRFYRPLEFYMLDYSNVPSEYHFTGRRNFIFWIIPTFLLNFICWIIPTFLLKINLQGAVFQRSFWISFYRALEFLCAWNIPTLVLNCLILQGVDYVICWILYILFACLYKYIPVACKLGIWAFHVFKL